MPMLLDGSVAAIFGKSLGDVAKALGADVARLLDDALAGRDVVHQRVHVGPRRQGLSSVTWRTLSMSPLRQDDGAINGAFAICNLEVLQSTTKIHLLITDVGLPGGLNGRQVADAAKTMRPDLKVLFITGYAENAALNHGHIGPGMEVLTKPFAIDELARRVERILER